MQNVIIIGSGCAGNTAEPFIIGGQEPGGQLSITSLVDNAPGALLRSSEIRAFGARRPPLPDFLSSYNLGTVSLYKSMSHFCSIFLARKTTPNPIFLVSSCR